MEQMEEVQVSDIDPAKQKHQRRIQQKNNHIQKQCKILKEYSIPVGEPHKLHKTRAMNCGNPHCYMCANPRKVFKEETMQERKHKQDKFYRDNGKDIEDV